MQARVTVLGSGTSHGVPVVGCDCRVCLSADPRDNRTRPSIYVQAEGGPSVLVDTSTDFRQQALARGVRRVDAILYTHSHADHIMGLDDIRRFNAIQGGVVPAFGDARTCADLRKTFAYIFDPPTEHGGHIPQVSLSLIEGRFNIGALGIEPVPVMHGRRPILGFRFGTFAYLTDCNVVPDQSWALLEGLDVLILDALRHRPHPTHFTVAEAVAAAERIGARQTYFTHICHDLLHADVDAALPRAMALAYDGLTFEIEAGAAWT